MSLLSFVQLTSKASRNLHALCLSAVMGAPLGWFESMPSGRILSRFAADLMVMDTTFGLMFDGLAQIGLSGLLLCAIISYVQDFYPTTPPTH